MISSAQLGLAAQTAFLLDHDLKMGFGQARAEQVSKENAAEKLW